MGKMHSGRTVMCFKVYLLFKKTSFYWIESSTWCYSNNRKLGMFYLLKKILVIVTSFLKKVIVFNLEFDFQKVLIYHITFYYP